MKTVPEVRRRQTSEVVCTCLRAQATSGISSVTQRPVYRRRSPCSHISTLLSSFSHHTHTSAHFCRPSATMLTHQHTSVVLQSPYSHIITLLSSFSHHAHTSAHFCRPSVTILTSRHTFVGPHSLHPHLVTPLMYAV